MIAFDIQVDKTVVVGCGNHGRIKGMPKIVSVVGLAISALVSAAIKNLKLNASGLDGGRSKSDWKISSFTTLVALE